MTFLSLVLLMWLPYTMRSGFNSETAFPYMSETSSFWGGFLYRVDPLRIFTNFFYHIAYILSEVMGVRGSFMPYQIVHAVLWFARGFLTFQILRKFIPSHIPF